MSNRAKTVLKYTITSAVGLIFTAIYLIGHLKSEATKTGAYKVWCDAFTVPGVILIMVFFLMWLSDKGSFDGISYAIKYAFSALIPMGRLKKQEKYADYLKAREEKRSERSGHSYLFLLVTGLAFMAVSVVFLILFYKAYGNHV